jgi:hypothetical protein
MGRAGGFRVLPSRRTPARDQQLDDPAALIVGAPFADTPSSRWVAASTDQGTGVTTPLTYDPRQGGGARFDDLDSDGAAEFLHLSLGDGGAGDQGPAADGEILLVNGQSVRFFEVVDASLDGLIGQEQGLAPVLDFTAFSPAQSVQATLVLSREADFDAISGFYRGLDAQGTVHDAAGNLVRPGEASYRSAALRADNLVTELHGLRVGDNQSSEAAVTISESSFLAPFAQVRGRTFFAYAAANVYGIGHFRTLGTNLFGLEDQFGGGDRDFDDHVIGFNVSQIV